MPEPDTTARNPINTDAARHALREIRRQRRDHAPVRVRTTAPDDTALTLPDEAVDLLEQALTHLAEGHHVTVIPTNTELTTQQAADLLGVSRPYLIKLLETGEMTYRTVGRHRRVLASSLADYRHRDDARRKAAADELSALDQNLDLT